MRKVRNKAAGTIGDCVLEYDRANGRYIDPDMEQYSARTARRVRYARPQQAQQAGQQQQQQPRAPAQGWAAPQQAQQQPSPQQVAAQQAQQLLDWQAQREQAREQGGGVSAWGPPPLGQQAGSGGSGQPDAMSMAGAELDSGDAISAGGAEYRISSWGTLEPVGGSNGGFE